MIIQFSYIGRDEEKRKNFIFFSQHGKNDDFNIIYTALYSGKNEELILKSLSNNRILTNLSYIS